MADKQVAFNGDYYFDKSTGTRYRPLRPPKDIKPKRSEKRKRMTLIAAIRCDEGVVICADGQETIGDVRVAVNKLVPQDLGHYQLAIAGSGNGDLIDGFVDTLAREIRTWPASLDETTAQALIHGRLLDFHRNEIECYPADRSDDKVNHFLVCIKPKETPDIFLWELRGSVIMPVGDYVLMGIGAAIYQYELRRLHRPKLRAMQAVLLAIHLFSLAKETSNYVGGQTDLIFVAADGIRVENAADVRAYEERMSVFNQALAELVLACPDTSISFKDYRASLERFVERAMKLHFEHVRAMAESAFTRLWTDENWAKGLYKQIPEGLQLHVKLIAHEGYITFRGERYPAEWFDGILERLNERLNSQKSEDQQSPCIEAYPETDRNASDD